MTSTNSIQFALRAAVKKLAEDGITDEELKKIITKKAGIELDDSFVLEITRNAKVCFTHQCNSEIDNLVQDDEILEKIEELKGLVKAAELEENGVARSEGWRPTGEPEIDAFGHIRKALLDYEKRLTDCGALLSKDVELTRVDTPRLLNFFILEEDGGIKKLEKRTDQKPFYVILEPRTKRGILELNQVLQSLGRQS